MLYTHKSPSFQFEEGRSPHDVDLAEPPSLTQLYATAIGFIRRQFLVILSFVPLTIGLAVVYLLVTPPQYKGVARILIDTGKLQVFKQSILEAPADVAMMDTQIEILKSENFGLSIIRKLGLTHDPEFVGSLRDLIGRTLRLLHLRHRTIVENIVNQNLILRYVPWTRLRSG